MFPRCVTMARAVARALVCALYVCVGHIFLLLHVNPNGESRTNREEKRQQIYVERDDWGQRNGVLGR